jgi:membrane associated rhomboid family serine protease
MIPIHDDNPTHRTPIVTVALIAACVLAYFWQVSLGPRAGTAVVYSFGFIPAVLFTDATLPPELAVVPAGVTLFTSMFLHGGFMHLAGNMIYLWVFGNNIEDGCGHVRFLLFYLLCGVAAAFAQALPNPASEVPMIGARPRARYRALLCFLGVPGSGRLAARVLVRVPVAERIGLRSDPARSRVLGAHRRLRRRHGADLRVPRAPLQDRRRPSGKCARPLPHPPDRLGPVALNGAWRRPLPRQGDG